MGQPRPPSFGKDCEPCYANPPCTPEREVRLFEAPLEALRAAIDEGDASGIAEGDVFEQVRETLHLAKIPG